jgi:hypothetical protein
MEMRVDGISGVEVAQGGIVTSLRHGGVRLAQYGPGNDERPSPSAVRLYRRPKPGPAIADHQDVGLPDLHIMTPQYLLR